VSPAQVKANIICWIIALRRADDIKWQADSERSRGGRQLPRRATTQQPGCCMSNSVCYIGSKSSEKFILVQKISSCYLFEQCLVKLACNNWRGYCSLLHKMAVFFPMQTTTKNWQIL